MAEHRHSDKRAAVIKPEAEPRCGVGTERVMGQNEGFRFAIVVDRSDVILYGADDFIGWAIKRAMMAPALIHTPTLPFPGHGAKVLVVSLLLLINASCCKRKRCQDRRPFLSHSFRAFRLMATTRPPDLTTAPTRCLPPATVQRL